MAKRRPIFFKDTLTIHVKKDECANLYKWLELRGKRNKSEYIRKLIYQDMYKNDFPVDKCAYHYFELLPYHQAVKVVGQKQVSDTPKQQNTVSHISQETKKKPTQNTTVSSAKNNKPHNSGWTVTISPDAGY